MAKNTYHIEIERDGVFIPVEGHFTDKAKANRYVRHIIKRLKHADERVAYRYRGNWVLPRLRKEPPIEVWRNDYLLWRFHLVITEYPEVFPS